MEQVLGKVTSMMGAIDELLLYDRKKVESSSYYQDGMKEGLKVGVHEGKQQEKYTIAKNLLDLNVAVPIIMKSTGLSKKEIKELQKVDLKKQESFL